MCTVFCYYYYYYYYYYLYRYYYYYYYYFYYYYYDKINFENNNKTDDRHISLAINIKLEYYHHYVIMYVI